MDARIDPASPPCSEPVQGALARIMPEGVPPLTLFRVLAVNERVFGRAMAGGLLDRGSISLREREIVILRTCARLGSEYEWGVHVTFFSAKAALSAEEVAATRAEAPAGFAGPERLLVHLVDALVDTRTVSDELFAELGRAYSPAQLVELVALVGYYHFIAFTTNAFRIAPEPYAARF